MLAPTMMEVVGTLLKGAGAVEKCCTNPRVAAEEMSRPNIEKSDLCSIGWEWEDSQCCGIMVFRSDNDSLLLLLATVSVNIIHASRLCVFEKERDTRECYSDLCARISPVRHP